MKVSIKKNNKNILYLNKKMEESLLETADAILSDLVESQTMPFMQGELQSSLFVERVNNKRAKVITKQNYSRRLYFHPEYNFSKLHNPNAGGMWFEPYLNGQKKDLAPKIFKRILGGKMK